MAVRGWGGSIATAICVAAGAGAAQLGLGYGLGIIAWQPATDAAGEAVWLANLTWATWIAATSVIAGAVAADRLSEPLTEPSTPDGPAEPTPMTTALWRVALAVAAAVGALVTVALVAVPAREAVRADTFSPQTIAAGYAVVGVVVGLLVAIAALTSRPVAANVIATVVWPWVLVVVVVIYGLIAGRNLTTAQLAVWEYTDGHPDMWFRNLYLPGVALSLGSAFVIGLLAAWPSARRAARSGGSRVGVAISGAAGPLLVAAAYLLAAPKPAGAPADQLSAYLIAPYTVVAGLAGSVLISTVTARAEASRRAAADRVAQARARATAGATADSSPEDDPTRPDLADDGYAPARAYVSESVGEKEPAAVRGQASVKTPLWPRESTENLTDAGLDEDTDRGRR